MSGKAIDIQSIMKAMDSNLGAVKKQQKRNEKGKQARGGRVCDNKQCGKKEGSFPAGMGIKLKFCTRCQYCSDICQKSDYQLGHKDECSAFLNAPWTSRFDPNFCEGTDWPINPIFARGNSHGLGMWVTMNGGVQGSLQYAHESILCDHSDSLTDAQNDDFRSWAGDIAGIPPSSLPAEAKKRHGRTLLTVSVALQNRREDGRDIIVSGCSLGLGANKRLKEFQIEGEDHGCQTVVIGPNKDFCLIPVWRDWNNQKRICISDINGRLIKPQKQREKSDSIPQVLDWETCDLVLSPGDFVVLSAQFRCGDGDDASESGVTYESQVWQAAFLFNLKAVIREPSISLSTQTKIAFSPLIAGEDTFVVFAPVDHAYLEEYYRPWIERGQDAFLRERLGSRAEKVMEMNDKMGKLAEAMTRQMWELMDEKSGRKIKESKRFKVWPRSQA
ncbi:hypothetical protein BT69DRAFT_1301659 [Atractiella rhizophila]|nr:hypothetical protein BT69DRAFT_1301659 [Atractiella rhizophila]